MKKILIYCVFAVTALTGCSKKESTVSAYEKSETKKIDSNTPAQNDALINFAKAIVDRAISITDLIPEKESRVAIKQGLELIVVCYSGEEGSITMPANQAVTLAITSSYLLTRNGSEAIFTFRHEDYLANRRVVLHMNADVEKYSTNIDVLATALIHEFLHVLQMKAELDTGKKFSMYENEVNAWKSQGYLLLQLYPEIANIEYACANEAIIASTPVQQALVTDYLIAEMVAFHQCGHLYLKKVYGQ